MIQLQDKLRPVKDGMFEVLVERDGIMRTSVDTQLAEHTSSEVIFIFCQDFLSFAVSVSIVSLVTVIVSFGQAI